MANNVLDREKLLLALKGQYRAKNVKPAWCQELSESYSGQLSELCIDGLQSLAVPIQKQSLNTFRAIARRLPDSGNFPAWWIDANRVSLKTKSTHFFSDTLSVFMKNAVVQLGLDPDHHNVSLKPNKLLIFESGTSVAPLALKFDNQPTDSFAVLMLQIPVEGGHRGADLTVRSKFGVTKIDRSLNNGLKFFLSASFTDCPHEISPLIQGFSLALTYNLVWENPLVVSPHRLNLPTFVASLNTVQEILSPWRSPEEDYDTELLVIPLLNDYAKTPLKYSNLRGTDKLMANLLQSTNELEIRLATLMHYRAGTAHDEQRMNTNRDGLDDGFPESPLETDVKDFPIVKSKRIIAHVIEENFSIEESHLLSGVGVSVNEVSSIYWKTDYIFNNTQSVKDIFDDTSPPDKEKYDRYNQSYDDVELRQWWYKPVIIFWPKNSTAIKCRRNFSGALYDLETSITQQPDQSDTQLSEFRKIVHFHNRHEKTTEDDVEELDNLPSLFSICNLLKAKQEGISLCLNYARNPQVVEWYDAIPEFAKFVDLVGWVEPCRSFFTSMVSSCIHPEVQMHDLIRMAVELLRADSPTRNEAVVQVFKQLYSTLIPSTETLSVELFTAKVDELIDDEENYGLVLLVIFLLERRQLLENAEELLTVATCHLKNAPITGSTLFFVYHLCSSSLLVSNSSFDKMPQQLQSSLVFICQKFLDRSPSGIDVHTIWPICHVVAWIQLVMFIGQPLMIHQLMDKILSRPSTLQQQEKTDDVLIKFLNTLLNELQKDPNLKTLSQQVKISYNVALKRRRYEIRQSISHLKRVISRLDHGPCHQCVKVPDADLIQLRQRRLEELRQIIHLYHKCLVKMDKMSPAEAEEEFFALCDLIALCNKLKSKELGLSVIEIAIQKASKGVWFRQELVAVLADFIALVGWAEFHDCFKSIWNLISEKQQVQKLCICLTNELLQKNQYLSEDAAANIFEWFLSEIELPYRQVYSSDEDFSQDYASCLSTLDEAHRAIFFHVVLLIDPRHDLPIEDLNEVVDNGIQFLQDSPISILNHFVKMLFLNPSRGLTASSFQQLTSVCQNTLKHLCSKFVLHFRSQRVTVATEDLVNWLRLIVYTGNVHADLLINHLSNSSHITSLQMLLASEEFQTDKQFKFFRDHPSIVSWKRTQEKEAFLKLFTPRLRPKNSNKRKVISEDSPVTRKKTRVTDSDAERNGFADALRVPPRET